MSKPFIKWVGGKRQVLPEIMQNLPIEIDAFKSGAHKFYEPFVGGGAVFFALNKLGVRQAILNDSNAELMNVYKVIQQVPETLHEVLKRSCFQNEKISYEEVRGWDRDKDWPYNKSDIERAARFIFLNKIGYNGLYRVNKKGHFNVPFGSYLHLNLPTLAELKEAQAALSEVKLLCEDFEDVCRKAQAGDLVYFDPPYIPLSATSSFVGYTPDGFNLDTQKRLRETCQLLIERKVAWVLSNSSTASSHEIFGSLEGVKTVEIYAHRNINSDSKKRKEVKELLFIYQP